MAEARSAVHEPHVGRIEEGRSAQHDFIVGLRASIIRRFFRTRNLIKNGMWPTSLWNLGALVLILSVLLIGDWELAKPVTSRLDRLEDWIHMPRSWPLAVRSFIISVLTGFFFFLILLHVRRYLLRLLLSYRGWMYEQPKTQGVLTVIWGLLVKVVSGSHPALYACQLSLPRQPVPPLKDTLKGLIHSLKPLYGEDSQIIQDLKTESKEFQRTLGPKLQSILYLKSWWAQSYVSDFWEKYVYLMGRSPLPINSNYYVLDQGIYCPTSDQIVRATSCIYRYVKVKQMVDREQLEPLLIRNTIPICMAQYEKVFSTTRVPGEEQDTLVHYESSVSKHIVVNRKGILYKVEMFDKNRKLIPVADLQKLLCWIMHDADKHQDSCSEDEKSVPALTGTDRKTWAQVRNQYFSQGINKHSLDIIEKALFCVILGTEIHDTYSTRARYLLHADGKSIWFDKSFTILVSPNGRMGMHCEHSYADAPVIAHILECNLTQEAVHGIIPGLVEDSKELIASENGLPPSIHKPQRLVFEVDEKLGKSIQIAYRNLSQAIEDIDLNVQGYTNYGKGFIKTCKVSPDAYIQMALQITYFKNAGKFALTYESSMTRLYLLGRTETVRSLTLESVEFVKAFLDKTIPPEQKISLLRRACTLHARMYKDCMNGKGIDRHLFALYVISKGLDYDCEFLKKCLSIPWTLSTSQAPQQQLASSPNCDSPKYRDKVSPGGGFGPVSDDGYGVAYMIPGDLKLFFHVSSKKSSKQTDSTLFMNQLFETLGEMKALFEEHSKTSDQKTPDQNNANSA